MPPKAGMRKRHSFFGRPSSEANNNTRPSSLHSTMTISGQENGLPSRSGNGLGETIRRKTDSLETIRNSIFGSRRKASLANASGRASALDQRPTSPQSRSSATHADLPREYFRTEAECMSFIPIHIVSELELSYSEDYRHLRKNSISPPFNFEHVTHTAQQDLPRLDTIDERDLAAKFWAISAYDRPKQRLNGIQAVDVVEKLERMNVPRGAPSSRPTSPVTDLPAELPSDPAQMTGSLGVVSSIDETIFDEARDTRFDPQEVFKPAHPSQQSSKRPIKKSSLATLNDQRLRFLEETPAPTFYESQSSGESDADHETSLGSPDANECAAVLASVPEEHDSLSLQRRHASIDRRTQPLPPLPQHPPAKRTSKSAHKRPKSLRASIQSTNASEKRSSKRSSRSTQQSSMSLNRPGSKEFNFPTMLSDARWEDDVDFCYQQHAESTCNFDWEGVEPQVRAASIAESDVDGGVRLSAWSPYSTLVDPLDSSPRPLTHGASSTRSSAIHFRGGSVGHRGFLAARKTSVESLQTKKKKKKAPPDLEFTPCPSRPGMLSPVGSESGQTGGNLETPFSPGARHLDGLDSFTSGSTEYLSDPESSRTGRTQPSSYGSYESVGRPNNSDAEKSRWSSGSTTSLPELLHSSRRSRRSIRKSHISQPLESLPQSPTTPEGPGDQGKQQEGSKDASDVALTSPSTNTLFMRRPQSTSDRAMLQAAGKAVQRTRPAPPNRFSQLVRTNAAQQAAAEHAGWI